MRIRTRILLAAALATAACATVTPYQPEVAGQRIHGGYSEQRLGDGRLPRGNGNLFDARKVMADLGPSIELPKQR